VSKTEKSEDNNNAVRHAEHDIFVKVNSILVKLNTREIAFIEALENYVTIHTDSIKYVVHTTIKGIETKLPKSSFIRVHLSYIARLDKISKIDNNLISINDKLIPISRSYKSELMNRIKVF
jgi:DNA-binding LytR/AlgR family response regulator